MVPLWLLPYLDMILVVIAFQLDFMPPMYKKRGPKDSEVRGEEDEFEEAMRQYCGRCDSQVTGDDMAAAAYQLLLFVGE